MDFQREDVDMTLPDNDSGGQGLAIASSARGRPMDESVFIDLTKDDSETFTSDSDHHEETTSLSSNSKPGPANLDECQPHAHTVTRQGTLIQGRRGGALMPNKMSSAAKEVQRKSKTKSHPRRRYRLPADLQISEKYKHPKFKCRVQAPYITLTCGDGDPSHRSYPKTHDKNNPPPIVNDCVNFFYPLPRNHSNRLLWCRKIGEFIAKQVLKLPDANKVEYCITDFPEHYLLVQHRNGPLNDLRTDSYLFGSETVTRFRSPDEFFPHLFWLLNEEDENGWKAPCDCQYCNPKKRTRA